MLEFTLPNALLSAAQEQIGPRNLARLSAESRSKVISALNVAAKEVAQVVGTELSSKRISSKRRRTPAEQSESAGASE